MAVAGGAQGYLRAVRVLTSVPARLVYALLIIAFCYHLVAGIRHLVWDTGRGLERAQSQKSAWLVVAVSIALICVLAYAWVAGARAP
jgi:succinate dehydrogenase / fumarate reductase cytochrome b subunit